MAEAEKGPLQSRIVVTERAAAVSVQPLDKGCVWASSLLVLSCDVLASASSDAGEAGLC
jgi:hypothetical protein